MVHKNGIADKRATELCPWVGWIQGDEVHLTRSHFQLYGLACDWYILELNSRVLRTWGSGPEPEALAVQADLASRINSQLQARSTIDAV